MAVSAVKTFIGGEVLSASDLNALNTRIISNGGGDLGSPRTKAFDMAGFELVLDDDGDTSITADTDDQIDFRVGGTDVSVMTATDFTFLGSSLVTHRDIRKLGLSGIASRISWTELRVSQIEEQSILEHQVFS